MRLFIGKYTSRCNFCACGSGRIYLHMEVDKGVFSVNDCSLSDVEEYCGYDAQKMLSSRSIKSSI